MIKRYCDCCGDEIIDRNKIDDNLSRLTGALRKPGGTSLLKVQVITAKDSSWNKGEFCKYCVIDALMKADDRHVVE